VSTQLIRTSPEQAAQEKTLFLRSVIEAAATQGADVDQEMLSGLVTHIIASRNLRQGDVADAARAQAIVIVLLNFASLQTGTSAGLSWSGLTAAAAHLDPGVTRIAVVLLVVGFGTKAGLAPLHAWLPGAHAQAPAFDRRVEHRPAPAGGTESCHNRDAADGLVDNVVGDEQGERVCVGAAARLDAHDQSRRGGCPGRGRVVEWRDERAGYEEELREKTQQ